VAQNAPAHEGGAKTSFDFMTPVGILGGLGALIVAFLMEHGQVSMLIGQVSPFIIIYGGTIIALSVMFPLRLFRQAPAWLGKAFFETDEDPLVVVQIFTRLAEKARREGLLSLEDEASQIENEFLRGGVQEVVDGTPPEQIQLLLETRIEQMEARHRQGVDFFEQGGGLSPTMGVTGTVLGLLVALAGLGEAGTEELGKSIAVAFIATFYGILTANFFWLPIAKRLRKKSEHEAEHMHMVVEGILAIQAGDAPRLVRTKLEGFLSPADRARSAQAGGQGAGATAAAAA
jgi:chemotaxis protein MotA